MMVVAWTSVALLSLTPHLFLGKPYASDVIAAWKTRLLQGPIVSTRGIQMYSRARKEYEDTTGVIVQSTSTIFLVRTEAVRTVVVSCLWNSTKPCKVSGFITLREWHESLFEDKELVYDGLDADERAIWDFTMRREE